MTRERVIVDIESLGEAAKVEETVNTGYCGTIEDNLVHWIAAEEDIMDSYSRLEEKSEPRSAKALQDLVVDSKDTVSELRNLLMSFESLSHRRTTRVEKLRALERET